MGDQVGQNTHARHFCDKHLLNGRLRPSINPSGQVSIIGNNVPRLTTSIFLTEETIIKSDFPEPTVVGPVVEGPSDIMSIPGGKNTGVTIDFDATGFTLAHDMVNVFFSSIPSFNGIIIDGFSGTVANSITSANGTANLFDIDGNPVPFSSDRVYYSDDAVFVNFSGLTFFDGDVEVDLIFSPVPLPSALWLFGAGIISLFGISHRKSKD